MIPAKRARDFPKAFLLKATNGKVYIVQTKGARAKELTFLFLVIGSVVQVGNPQVVPTNDGFAEVCMAVIAKEIKP